MRTSLYEKVFLDGFHKPSYVVATLGLASPPGSELVPAILATLERHPRLRSLVRTRLGVPVAFDPQPVASWLSAGGLRRIERADLHALEEELLGGPLDARRRMPLEVYLVDEPPALVVKVHHAVIDGASGFALLDDFAAVRSQRRLRRERASWFQWLARAQLRPRVPEVSLVTCYQPGTTLEREPVAYRERVLYGAHAQLVAAARCRSATFSELVASALLSAMSKYNDAVTDRPPAAVGLMFARGRARGQTASFRADTGVVSVPRSRLATPHHPATLAELRRVARDRRHNGLALAALYVARKVRGKARAPLEQRSLHFTLSDVTAFGRRPRSGLTDLRVLASPTSFDHAGMIVSRFGDDVRLALIAHRGALDAEELLATTVRILEES